MPQMSGDQTAELIKQLHPDLPIILLMALVLSLKSPARGHAPLTPCSENRSPLEPCAKPSTNISMLPSKLIFSIASPFALLLW